MTNVTLGNTIGASFLGTVAASILYGITALQIYLYYITYPKDWRFQKVAVGILAGLDTIHLGLTIHAVYHYVITEFGNLAAQQFVVWSFKLQIAVNVVIVLMVQSLYTLRVWKLGRHHSRVWPIIVIALVGAGYIIGIYLAVETYRLNTFADLKGMNWVVYASFSSATSVDIAIATAIVYYLRAARTSFAGTNNRIISIMRYVLISGFLTSACSLTALITYAALPNTLVFLGVEFLLTKLYINSYIAMLNARTSVRDTESSSANVSVSKILNLRTGDRQPTDSTHVMVTHDDKIDQDAIHLTPTEYRGKLDHELTSDSKGRSATGTSPSPHLGITVHRSEQRYYDSERTPA
ncbi:unnamed protein product [Cyclocybe aegerita]|uniref:DUF6534 domain-containing protein n=1 Tax=Cyclocybe aegerita TaxID=1973307 RepID=A0A8S0WYZ6_CYCAE|nr:unnamed protein product [Cyclocybe aegerita]